MKGKKCDWSQQIAVLNRTTIHTLSLPAVIALRDTIGGSRERMPYLRAWLVTYLGFSREDAFGLPSSEVRRFGLRIAKEGQEMARQRTKKQSD
jgi:hypothetical protein